MSRAVRALPAAAVFVIAAALLGALSGPPT